MQVYFDIVYRDNGWSNFGSTWIVPANYYSSNKNIAPVILSHDCGSSGEINHVIDWMIDDLEALRRKAHKHYDALKLHKQLASTDHSDGK